jgi:hypothetical protein
MPSHHGVPRHDTTHGNCRIGRRAEFSMLELDSVTKRYDGQFALDNVSVSLARGSVVGIASGAGRSTLLNIGSGIVQADTGTMRLDGREIRPGTYKEANELGIWRVFQDRRSSVAPPPTTTSFWVTSQSVPVRRHRRPQGRGGGQRGQGAVCRRGLASSTHVRQRTPSGLPRRRPPGRSAERTHRALGSGGRPARSCASAGPGSVQQPFRSLLDRGAAGGVAHAQERRG